MDNILEHGEYMLLTIPQRVLVLYNLCHDRMYCQDMNAKERGHDAINELEPRWAGLQ